MCLLALSSQAQTRQQRGAAFDQMSAAMRRNYVSNSDEMRWSGIAIIAAHQFEGNEAWKYAKPGQTGWFYKPYLRQSTRPLMIPIGITFTIGGIATILRNVE